MEVVVTTGDIRRANLQSDHHHQQTNIHLFTGRMPFLSPNQQCQSGEGENIIQWQHTSIVSPNKVYWMSAVAEVFKEMSACRTLLHLSV